MSQRLSVKQKAFADHYIKTGNATESYKVAGYSWTNDNVASSNGQTLLKNKRVIDYISKRSKKIDEKVFEEQVDVRAELYKRIGELSGINFANNTVKDKQYTEVDEQGNEIRVTESTVPVRSNDLTRMLELLAKINGDIGSEENNNYNVTIVNDIGEE